MTDLKEINVCTLVLYDDGDMPELNFFTVEAEETELEMKAKLIKKYFETSGRSDCSLDESADMIKINEMLVRELAKKEGLHFEY